MDSNILVSIRDVTKQFPGVTALDEVSLDIKRGEIRAIVGENGAGKSTLINILSGVLEANKGEIYYKDELLNFSHPMQALEKGIAVVHQELNTVKHLDVAENIFLGQLKTKKFLGLPLLDRRSMHLRAEQLLDLLKVDIDVAAKGRSLSIPKQQIVEICKALAYDAELIILDEPSAVLTEKEIQLIFSILKTLQKEGVTIIYISHRLEEIFEIADTVTIMRDGKIVNTYRVADITKKQLVTDMVGREVSSMGARKTHKIGSPVLEVKDLSHKGLGLKGISFTLHEGEILGIAGLVGAGRTELVKCLFGDFHPDEGEVFLEGKPVKIRKVRDAIKKGLALVPEDRKGEGIIQGMQVQHNVSMVDIDRVLRYRIVSRHKERQLAQSYVESLNIRVPDVTRLARNLSGGNQQKVVLAKWLAIDANVLIFDEPTRGIDVGAKAEIYNLLSELSAEGKSLLIISSEMLELLDICDRILVMHEGRISGELQRDEFSQSGIMRLMVGGDDN